MLELDETPRRPIFLIRDRRIFLVIGIALLLIAASAAWYLLTPRVVSMSPGEKETDILSAATIQVTFNQDMDQTNLQELLLIEPAIPGTYTWVERTLVFSPNGHWPADQKVKVKLTSKLRSALRLPVIGATEWTFSIKHAWLLYLINVAGKVELYRLDPTGIETERLITSDTSILDYQAIPDGKSILYTTLTGAGTEIRYADLETGTEKVIHNCDKGYCYMAALSRDMNYLAFVSGAIPETGIKNYSTVWMLPLRNLEAAGEPFKVSGNDDTTRDPSWSGDGWLAYYDDSEKGFGFYHAKSGNRQFLANDTGEAGYWSPVENIYYFSEIVYSQSVDPTAPMYYSRLSGYSIESEQTGVVSTNDQSEEVGPVVSPDGKKIAFGRRLLTKQDWTPGRQLWVQNSDGSNPKAITNQPLFNHLGFSWSPDGTQIAFTRFNTASLTSDRELWIADSTTGITRKLLVNAYDLQWLD